LKEDFNKVQENSQNSKIQIQIERGRPLLMERKSDRDAQTKQARGGANWQRRSFEAERNEKGQSQKILKTKLRGRLRFELGSWEELREELREIDSCEAAT
jgi:hypothetical protein